MRHDDICIITRTTTTKTPGTNIAKPQTTTLDPFNCRLGRSSGTLVQGQPQGTFTKQLRLYIPNVLADIKSGDIAMVTITKLNTTAKYTVGNIGRPNNHHIEADVTFKEEV
jgi:hypothetical protein